MAYLVKFVSKVGYKPNALNCFSFELKIGTFHHYRKIEDERFRDESEGQSGREVVIRRPCAELLKLSSDPSIPFDCRNIELDDVGRFVPRVWLLVSEHLKDFNAWIFCCSIIEELHEIPRIQNRFEAESFYFITRPKRFETSILRSLGADLVSRPVSTGGRLRVKPWSLGSELWVDGYKDKVKYTAESSWMSTIETETLSDFLAHHSAEVDRNLWFGKSERFRPEQEFRWVFYPTSEHRPKPQKFLTVRDDSILIKANLCGCVSSEPSRVDWEA